MQRTPLRAFKKRIMVLLLRCYILISILFFLVFSLNGCNDTSNQTNTARQTNNYKGVTYAIFKHGGIKSIKEPKVSSSVASFLKTTQVSFKGKKTIIVRATLPPKWKGTIKIYNSFNSPRIKLTSIKIGKTKGFKASFDNSKNKEKSKVYIHFKLLSDSRETTYFTLPKIHAYSDDDRADSDDSRNNFRWQWILTGWETLDKPSDYEKKLGTKLDVIDFDYEIDKEIVEAYREVTSDVICYMSVGTYENWREDLPQDEHGVILAPLNSGVPYSIDDVLGLYDDEFFIDIGAFKLDPSNEKGYRISYEKHSKKDVDGLKEIMRNRIEIAASKNCSAVEFDNMDIHFVDEEKYNNYSSKTGGNATGRPNKRNQVAYVLWLSEVAHANGMDVVLKNSHNLLDYEVKAKGREPTGLMDLVRAKYIVAEECYWWGICDIYQSLGKKYDTKILAVEYMDLLKRKGIYDRESACRKFDELDSMYVLIKKNRELVPDRADYYPCNQRKSGNP